MLTLPAPAKVNLFLHVVGRYDDGYHRLQTHFQLVDLTDEVTLIPAPEGVIELTEDSDGPRDGNLVVRAAARLREAAGPAREGSPPRGVRIRLRKQLPTGGGLGGGSSNAATTLVGLDLGVLLAGTDLEHQTSGTMNGCASSPADPTP